MPPLAGFMVRLAGLEGQGEEPWVEHVDPSLASLPIPGSVNALAVMTKIVRSMAALAHGLVVVALLLPGGTAAATAFEPPGFLFTWGTPGTADGQFSQATGVTVDPASGRVYAADRYKDPVQVVRGGRPVRRGGGHPGHGSRPVQRAAGVGGGLGER